MHIYSFVNYKKNHSILRLLSNQTLNILHLSGRLLTDLQCVYGAVQGLPVCWRSTQTFDLLPQPILGCFMLLHQLSALPLCQDALLQLGCCSLQTTEGSAWVSSFCILQIHGTSWLVWLSWKSSWSLINNLEIISWKGGTTYLISVLKLNFVTFVLHILLLILFYLLCLQDWICRQAAVLNSQSALSIMQGCSPPWSRWTPRPSSGPGWSHRSLSPGHSTARWPSASATSIHTTLVFNHHLPACARLPEQEPKLWSGPAGCGPAPLPAVALPGPARGKHAAGWKSVSEPLTAANQPGLSGAGMNPDAPGPSSVPWWWQQVQDYTVM